MTIKNHDVIRWPCFGFGNLLPERPVQKADPEQSNTGGKNKLDSVRAVGVEAVVSYIGNTRPEGTGACPPKPRSCLAYRRPAWPAKVPADAGNRGPKRHSTAFPSALRALSTRISCRSMNPVGI